MPGPQQVARRILGDRRQRDRARVEIDRLAAPYIQNAPVGEHHAQPLHPRAASRRSGNCATRWRCTRCCRRSKPRSRWDRADTTVPTRAPRHAHRAAALRRPPSHSPGWISRRVELFQREHPAAERHAAARYAGARAGDRDRNSRRRSLAQDRRHRFVRSRVRIPARRARPSARRHLPGNRRRTVRLPESPA